MAVMDQLIGEAAKVVARGLDDPQLLAARQQSPTSSALPTPSQSSGGGGGGNGGGNGPTSSPLLFFVALGFGVVFTNLWIIVGVKYCFRYNARNRALRNGEDVDQINMDNMPTRPHRRRKEKKLMTMDEVNERFPLTKYKAWVANRLTSGLPTAGGVTAPSSRAGSIRDADATLPSSPVETKHSVNTRPGSAASDAVAAPNNNNNNNDVQKDQAVAEKDKAIKAKEEKPKAEDATAAPVGKQVTTASLDDDDDDDHIHTAVPPELLTNPGDSCAICIDTLEDDDDVRGLTCGHAFHAGCLDPWLTSRRACCPLCKADYYTPKPRPEGEVAAEPDRSHRRRGDSRMNLPQEPRSTWAGLRGGHRMMLSSRMTGESNTDDRRRDRRQPTSTTPAANPTATPEVTENTSGQGRWRNPFAGLRRNRNDEQPAAGTSDPSPRQLEAGTATTAAPVR